MTSFDRKRADRLMSTLREHAPSQTVDTWEQVQRTLGDAFFTASTLDALEAALSDYPSSNSQEISGQYQHVAKPATPRLSGKHLDPYQRAMELLPGASVELLDSFAQLLLATSYTEFLNATVAVLREAEGEQRSVHGLSYLFPQKAISKVWELEGGSTPVFIVYFDASARYSSALAPIFQRYPDAIIFALNTYGVKFCADFDNTQTIRARTLSHHSSFNVNDNIYTLIHRFLTLRPSPSESQSETTQRWKGNLVSSPSRDWSHVPRELEPETTATLTFEGLAAWEAYHFFRVLDENARQNAPWDYLHSLSGLLAIHSRPLPDKETTFRFSASKSQRNERFRALANSMMVRERIFEFTLNISCSSEGVIENYVFPCSIPIPDASWTILSRGYRRALWPTTTALPDAIAGENRLKEPVELLDDEDANIENIANTSPTTEGIEAAQLVTNELLTEIEHRSYIFTSPPIRSLGQALAAKLYVLTRLDSPKSEADRSVSLEERLHEKAAVWCSPFGELDLVSRRPLEQRSLDLSSFDLWIERPLILDSRYCPAIYKRGEIQTLNELKHVVFSPEPDAPANLLGEWTSNDWSPVRTTQKLCESRSALSYPHKLANGIALFDHDAPSTQKLALIRQDKLPSRHCTRTSRLAFIAPPKSKPWQLATATGEKIPPRGDFLRCSNSLKQNTQFNLVKVLRENAQDFGGLDEDSLKDVPSKVILQPFTRPIVVHRVEQREEAFPDLGGEIRWVTFIDYSEYLREPSSILTLSGELWPLAGIFCASDLQSWVSDEGAEAIEYILFDAPTQRLEDVFEATQNHSDVLSSAKSYVEFLKGDRQKSENILVLDTPVEIIEDVQPHISKPEALPLDLLTMRVAPNASSPTLTALEITVLALLEPAWYKLLEHQTAFRFGDQSITARSWLTSLIKNEVSVSTDNIRGKSSLPTPSSAWLLRSRLKSELQWLNSFPDISQQRWRCECGKVEGFSNLWVRCSYCKTSVTHQFLAPKDAPVSGITLPFSMIHPWARTLFTSLLGLTHDDLEQENIHPADIVEQVKRDAVHLDALLEKSENSFPFETSTVRILKKGLSTVGFTELLSCHRIKKPHPLLTYGFKDERNGEIFASELAASFRELQGLTKDYADLAATLTHFHQTIFGKAIAQSSANYFGEFKNDEMTPDTHQEALLGRLESAWPPFLPTYYSIGIANTIRGLGEPIVVEVEENSKEKTYLFKEFFSANNVYPHLIDESVPRELTRIVNGNDTVQFVPMFNRLRREYWTPSRQREWYCAADDNPPIETPFPRIRAIANMLSEDLAVAMEEDSILTLYRMAAFFSTSFKHIAATAPQDGELNLWPDGVSFFRELLVDLVNHSISLLPLLQWFGFTPLGSQRQFNTQAELRNAIENKVLSPLFDNDSSCAQRLRTPLGKILGGITVNWERSVPWQWEAYNHEANLKWAAPRLSGRPDRYRFNSLELLYTERPHLVLLFNQEHNVAADIQELLHPKLPTAFPGKELAKKSTKLQPLSESFPSHNEESSTPPIASTLVSPTVFDPNKASPISESLNEETLATGKSTETDTSRDLISKDHNNKQRSADPPEDFEWVTSDNIFALWKLLNNGEEG